MCMICFAKHFLRLQVSRFGFVGFEASVFVLWETSKHLQTEPNHELEGGSLSQWAG